MLFYRWLLRLFPSSFRNEYGREMVAVFARQRRDARGPFAVAALWMRAIADTCVGSAAVHRDIAAQDLRYTVRTLARAPGFMMTALLVIGLGVGATTAAFSVTDYVLLRPLPFPESQRLVKVWEQRPGFTRMELAPANYRDWKRMAQSFESFAAYRGLSVNLVGGSQPMRIQGAVWTAEMLDTLGVQPLIGRGFTPADDRDGAPGTVLLSHGLWQREFGGAESVAGRTIRLDDQVYTIIGVMPHGFHFPTRDAELWAPMRFAPAEFEDRNDNYLNAIARLRPGVSLDAARAEMDLLAARLTAQYPKENEHSKTLVIGLRDELSAQSRMMLVAVLGAAGCLLLIACANLANLLLARAIVRRREVAIRLALGAGHERLLRQLLTESLVLTGLGGALGVALAAVMLPLLSRLVPASLPVAAAPAIDWRVLAFAATVTIATGLVFGVLPLIHSRPARAGDGLREGARAGGGQRERLRGALVVAEITASVVLLVLCGLLLRALWRIQATDPGFTTDSALAVRTSLPMPKYETVAARTAFYSRVLSDVRAIPGVSHAGYISFLPMGDMRGGIFPVGVNGVVEDRRQNQVASLRYVTPGFFDALRIPLHRGRDVSESDTSDRQYVAVVSETFASQFFPGQDPIGRRFNFARADREIVGVVGDVKVRGLARVSEPQVYVPHQQVADALFVWYSPKDLVVRTAGNPLALVNAVRGVVRAADPDQPISDVQTLDDLVGHETVARVAQLRVLGAFAVIAVLLGAIGIHGLLAFAVSARTAEIGVRMALGARRMDIIELVVARSLMLATAGIASGVVLAYWSGRAAQSLLAGVEPGDAATFAVAVGVTVAMTIAGSVRPALRAARIDPVTVMRIE